MVSVIVPNYNHALYLNKRIDSILNQTYQDFELILLDDFSTDNSREILEEYKNNEKVSHIVYNEINSGSTFIQWKKGIELAKGEYIWIAESDDWAESFMLEKFVEACNDNTAIVYCNSLRTWNDTIVQDLSLFNFSYKEYNGRNFIEEKMLIYNSIENASMAIFKKEYINMTWFDEIMNMKYCGDWLFWIKLANKGNVIEFTEAFNFFRQHEFKVTSKAKKNGLDFTEGMVVLKYIEKNYNIPITNKIIRYWAKVWVDTRFYFNKGITILTFRILISFKARFLYYIPVELFLKKYNRLKKK